MPRSVEAADRNWTCEIKSPFNVLYTVIIELASYLRSVEAADRNWTCEIKNPFNVLYTVIIELAS